MESPPRAAQHKHSIRRGGHALKPTGAPASTSIPIARTVCRYTTLWLLGAALRITLLAIPPLIPLIHRELALSETAVSILTSLPILLLSAGALVGSLLIFRIGIRNAVLVGVVTVAVFSASRGVLSSRAILFSCTLLMGLGIAVLQPSMPVLVKDWFPRKIGVATAVYSNGMLVGQVLGAGLTLPLMLPLAHGSWAGALALWSIPIAAIVPMVLFAAHPLPDLMPAWEKKNQSSAPHRLAQWLPDWRDATMWQLGLIMGGSSSLYFAANAFLPDYLHLLGRVGAIAPTLSAMSLLQIGAPLLVLASPGHFVGRRVPFIISGIAALTCVGAILIGRGEKIVLAAALLGFSTALILTISLTLPALLAAPEQVHRVSAGMFAIAYGCATIYPVLGGILWDLTRIPELAFAPGMAGMALGIVLSFAVNLQPARALNGQPATGNGRRA